jgi:cell cycle protein kinase DBF2
MASFMANFFPGSKDKSQGDASSSRPATPKTNSFINPTSTPQGSPSKKTAPPGAHDLPAAFDHAMSLTSAGLESPTKLSRPQSVITPLSPGRSNAQPLDESSINVDDSVIHKGNATSPLKNQGQENTPPASRAPATDSPHQHNQAALSRQQPYELRDRPRTPAAKKFNTSRGLTAEEREILQKPNVKRLVNVTQLCT